jgi:chromosome segregation ATPase
MGPPRLRSETVFPALSPARQALADHLEHLAKLAAEVERKSKPVARLREQLSAAHVDLQNAEHVLADIDAAHSAAIAKAAREDCCSEQPVESSDAEAAVSRARRNVNSIRMALEEVSQDQIQANANLEAAKTRFDQLALDILVEEFSTRLPQWALQRDKFHLAEIDMLGLLQALGEHGRALESRRSIP